MVIYENDNHKVIADVIIDQESIWMSQKQLADLFEVGVPAINKYLSNIFSEGELDEKATISKMEIVQNEGERKISRNTNFYNLDAIIAVGYRVNSKQATHFRQWATTTLKEYMIKGFVIDDDRLKQGETLLGKDYFKELLERVRSIRASERRIWQQITDIFAEISTDYDKDSQTAKLFYANMQNKLHYAIIDKTVAEIIYTSAGHQKENMGLTTWKNSPDGRILKSNTHVAKNYLSEKEIKALERNVSGFFDYIEDLIERRNTFTMKEFANSIDRFLEFRDYEILPITVQYQ